MHALPRVAESPHDRLALPTHDDVLAAAARLLGHAHRTPVMTSKTLDAELGAQVFIRVREPAGRMGAFRFRSAFNAVALPDAGQRQLALLAFSQTTMRAIALSRGC